MRSTVDGVFDCVGRALGCVVGLGACDEAEAEASVNVLSTEVPAQLEAMASTATTLHSPIRFTTHPHFIDGVHAAVLVPLRYLVGYKLVTTQEFPHPAP